MKKISNWWKKWERLSTIQDNKQDFENSVEKLLHIVLADKKIEKTTEITKEFNKRLKEELEKKLKRINEEKVIIEKYLGNG